MPYTLAHPMFLLWSKRKFPKVSITAIIIASITPDFDILLRLTDTRIHIFQYNLKDILLLILPISFGIWLYYELCLKKIIVPIFPFLTTEDFKVKDFGLVLLTMLISILVHLFLDLISHWDAFNLSMIIGWNTGDPILTLFFYGYALYGNTILFSALGLFLMTKYINFRTLLKFRPNKSQTIYFILLFIFTSIFFLFKIFMAVKEHQFFIDIIIINFTGALVFAFLTTPILFFILQKSKLIHAQPST